MPAYDSPALTPEPSVWRRAWEGWKRIAHRIGIFQTRVIMSLLYFIIVLPIGLVMRVVSDPLHLRPRPDSNWSPLRDAHHDLDTARQQF